MEGCGTWDRSGQENISWIPPHTHTHFPPTGWMCVSQWLSAHCSTHMNLLTSWQRRGQRTKSTDKVQTSHRHDGFVWLVVTSERWKLTQQKFWLVKNNVSPASFSLFSSWNTLRHSLLFFVLMLFLPFSPISQRIILGSWWRKEKQTYFWTLWELISVNVWNLVHWIKRNDWAFAEVCHWVNTGP